MRPPFPEYVTNICRVLRDGKYEAYVVGGAVRDTLLGLKPNDYDISTDCRPGAVTELFEAKGFRVLPTGIKYGTVSVVIAGGRHEITTYRKESGYTDGRRPDKVEFVKDIGPDLARRDFTINAMACDPFTGKLIDDFDGAGDLKRKIIRCVGDPCVRIGEDLLRMLRAVRYAARFDFAIEHSAAEAIKKFAPEIVKISDARILSEIQKMSEDRRAGFSRAIELLKVTGLFRFVRPQIDAAAAAK